MEGGIFPMLLTQCRWSQYVLRVGALSASVLSTYVVALSCRQGAAVRHAEVVLVVSRRPFGRRKESWLVSLFTVVCMLGRRERLLSPLRPITVPQLPNPGPQTRQPGFIPQTDSHER